MADTLIPGALPQYTVLAGRYTVLEARGKGGFGITYRALDNKQETGRRQVAIKECFIKELMCYRAEDGKSVLTPQGNETAFQKAQEYILREAYTLKDLVHPGIVRYHGFFSENNTCYCVMDWLDGGSLRDRMNTPDQLSADASQDWLSKLLDALDYMHRKEIVHRDLRPDNIMFDSAYEAGNAPIIIDFGIALNRQMNRELECHTTKTAQTPGYAPLEQDEHSTLKIGAYTDLYALCATWYELLTGVCPPRAQARRQKDKLSPLWRVNRRMDYPVDLLVTIQQNLALLPEERCSSVADWHTFRQKMARRIQREGEGKWLDALAPSAAPRKRKKQSFLSTLRHTVSSIFTRGGR